MKRTGNSAGIFVPLLLTAVAAIVLSSGCNSQKPADTSPAVIKSDMGGNYSPSAAAEGRAYQQKEVAKTDQMQQQNARAGKQ